jgi:hypothetical protein
MGNRGDNFPTRLRCFGANSEMVRLRRQTALEWNSGLQAQVLRTEDLVPKGLSLSAPTYSRGAGQAVAN